MNRAEVEEATFAIKRELAAIKQESITVHRLKIFILNVIGVKMTLNCDYESVVCVILPVEDKILPIVLLKL